MPAVVRCVANAVCCSRMYRACCCLLPCLQEHSTQQLQEVEQRMADAQAQMLAAQQIAVKADAQAKQLLQEKEQTVRAMSA